MSFDMLMVHGPKYVVLVDLFEIDKPGSYNIFVHSGVFKINLSKRNFNEVIWKENIIEHLLKNIRRSIDYKIIFGPSAETVKYHYLSKIYKKYIFLK